MSEDRLAKRHDCEEWRCEGLGCRRCKHVVETAVVESDLRAALRECRHELRRVSDDHGYGPAREGFDFLDWIAARLVNRYGESENVDFVIALREKAEAVRRALATVNRILGEEG